MWLLLAAAVLGTSVGRTADLEGRSLQPPLQLPDGTEFRTWEVPSESIRTYHVNPAQPGAADTNPGTAERPFASINRAAQVLQPGERVVVAGGVYRERIKPARGGTGPDKMISYEAAPGATVTLKGSRMFQPKWASSGEKVWQAKLESGLFEGYNPFAVANVTPKQFETMDWATPLRGKTPYTLPRGLVFQDGRRLIQVAAREALAGTDGSYWVDVTSQALYVRPYDDVSPAGATFEITTQETVFAPEEPGLGYIRVKGFVVEHTGGPWPWEQVGAISTTRGHHWIIEQNTVRWANGVGIDVGSQHPRLPQPAVIGHHIVRRNLVTDCGICGICGLGPGGGRDFGLLIEDNALWRNAFHDVERLFETAGIKTHNNVRCVIRRNLIVDTPHGAGIWMDWDNRFSRCMQNVIVGAATMHGGIFVEASFEPNLVDQNFIWGTTGHGIYEHDSCRQVFAHNFIGNSSKSALHLHGKITDRRIAGRSIVGGRHEVRNNVWCGSGLTNEFRGEPSVATGNLGQGVSARFDLKTMELTWSTAETLPETSAVVGVTHDFQGRARTGQTVAPGPFGSVSRTETRVKVWPVEPTQPPAGAGWR